MAGRISVAIMIIIFSFLSIKAQKKEEYFKNINVKEYFNKSESVFFIQRKKALSNKAKDKIIDSILVSFSSGNMQKLIFHYNNNQFHSFDIYKNRNNVWTPISRERYSFDSTGRISDIYQELWDNGWNDFIWEKNNFNEEGKKIGYIIKTWVDSRWENSSQMFTENDSVNKVSEQYTQKWINNNWVNYFKISTDLVQNDTLKTFLGENWENNLWKYSFLQYIELNVDETIKTVLNRKWSGIGWENDSKVIYYYGSDKENKLTYQFWQNNVWNDADRFVYNTDEDYWFLNGRYEILDNDSWIPSDGPITIMNPDGFELHFWAKTMQVFYSNPLAVNTQNNSQINYFGLLQNYPNPFNPATTINYNINNAGNVIIKVYDALGREIKTLVNEYKAAGSYRVEFNAAGLPSGVYLYKLTSGSNSKTNKMLYLK